MKYIKILENGRYLPEMKISNDEIEKKLNLENGYIEKRTGIKERYYIKDESIEEIAIKAVENLFYKLKNKNQIEDIGLIITCTTTSKSLMPGISNTIQKVLNLNKCICLDILAGCAGYINAFDIAKLYIETEKVKKALIVGVDTLSKYLDFNDTGTSIILSDGAGATLLEGTKEEKQYISIIEASGNNNEILTCKVDEKIKMNGREIYKYAVTETVDSINRLIKGTKLSLEDIKYIVPHQSNLKILNAIANRLKINSDKIYSNIEYIGNTFCASIPIALEEMMRKNLLKEGDKIILLGYGGGLNTGSILLEL